MKSQHCNPLASLTGGCAAQKSSVLWVRVAAAGDGRGGQGDAGREERAARALAQLGVSQYALGVCRGSARMALVHWAVLL